MSETLTIEDVIIALEDYHEARDAYRECVAECEVSAGYHCSRQYDRYHAATESFKVALDAYIDARIRRAAPPSGGQEETR